MGPRLESPLEESYLIANRKVPMWEPGNATSEVCNQCSSYLLGTTAQWLWSDSGGGVKVTLSFYCRVYNMIVRISISKCHTSISLSLNSLAIGNTIFFLKLLMLMVTQNCTGFQIGNPNCTLEPKTALREGPKTALHIRPQNCTSMHVP